MLQKKNQFFLFLGHPVYIMNIRHRCVVLQIAYCIFQLIFEEIILIIKSLIEKKHVEEYWYHRGKILCRLAFYTWVPLTHGCIKFTGT